MSETYRYAREDELDAIAQLVSHSFVSQTAEAHAESLRAGPWGGYESLWVAAEDDRPVAACQLLALRQWVGGVTIPVMGMATVTVAPTHRRRGLAGRLVTTGLRAAIERGDTATALYPFRVSFYERLGYGRAGEAHQYRVPPEVIPDAPERVGVSLAESPEDWQEIRAIYDRWVRTQSGQLERTDVVWERILSENGRAAVLYRNDEGAAEGYAVVRYRTDRPVAERFLEVQERAWLTSRARRGLYAWLGSLGDQWRLLVYRAHVAERFGDRIEEPRIPPGSEPGWNLWFPSAVLLRGPMFRLLDVPAALMARPSYGRETLTMALEIEDETLPECAGSWRLHLEDGVPTLEAGPARQGDVKITAPISTLSRLYVGALTPSEAVNQGCIWIDGLNNLPALNAAFSINRPWTFDGF